MYFINNLYFYFQDNLEYENLKVNVTSETLNDQIILDNNDYLVSPVNEDTEMLLQDTNLQTVTSAIKNDEFIEHTEKINSKTNDTNMSTGEDTRSKVDIVLDPSRRKFESEIGRDIVHERRMRKELMENSSSTG